MFPYKKEKTKAQIKSYKKCPYIVNQPKLSHMNLQNIKDNNPLIFNLKIKLSYKFIWLLHYKLCNRGLDRYTHLHGYFFF